ncbi:MAG TPA: 6-phosphogluconolactonase [Acidimicrobiales bacterium]|nr:MAG: hypothetical protein B7Z69_04255 [Actinobacteria bacterium 21-73-9]HQU26175.1 6-phosphogluconolactonase [Acidimicrobiales bacterium]
MRVVRARGAEAFDAAGAAALAGALRAKPTLALTLPTGGTPRGLYRALAAAHARAELSLERARVFMLDEYLDLATYPEGSFAAYLREHLGEVVFNGSTRFHALAPDDDPARLAAYDRALDEAGGLDLAVVGVGRNGHVGFNEPGSPVTARTRVVELSADTLEANFPDVAAARRPRRAVTMGLADLTSARAVLMLIKGEGKSGVARRLLDEGGVDPAVPATHLLAHRDLTIVVEAGLLS